MGKILTQAQKTFTDLYDSYVLNLSSDIVAVPCDQDGKAAEDCSVEIQYEASVGTAKVGAVCDVISSTVPSGVVCDTSTNGKIIITVPKDTGLIDDSEVGFTFTTTNANAFTFTRYLALIKVKSGTNGENARSFQIKSELGDTFTEGISEITMTAVAFDGLTEITDATYAWYHYVVNVGWAGVLDDSESTGENEVTTIFSEKSLKVNKNDEYANSVFRCVVTYNNGETDEDYYQLKTAVYNFESTVKFFGGTNTISSSNPFLIAYIDLYKDYQKIEGTKADYYYYHQDNKKNASGLTVNFDNVDDGYKKDGGLMYVIYKDESVAQSDISDAYTISTQSSPSTAGEVIGGGSYDYGANIILTAVPSEGYVFEKWNDGITTNPRTMTVTGDATYTASFVKHTADSYIITATSADSKMGSVSGSGTYESGSLVTLTATANVGYVFEDWYEDNVEKNWPKSINLTVLRDRRLIAKFREINSGVSTEYTITNNSSESVNVYKGDMTYIQFTPSTTGTYRFYSEANVSMDCYLYDYSMSLLAADVAGSANDKLSVTAHLESGQTYYFGVTVSEYGSSSTSVLVFLEDADPISYTITVRSNDPSMGYVSGSGTYEAGTSITLSATPYTGYKFTRWNDGNMLTTRRIVVNEDETYTAYFSEATSSYFSASIEADGATSSDKYYLSSDANGNSNLGTSNTFVLNDDKLLGGNYVYYYAKAGFQAGFQREITKVDLNGDIIEDTDYLNQQGWLTDDKTTFIYSFPVLSVALGMNYRIKIYFSDASSSGGTTSYTISTTVSPSGAGTVSGSGTYANGTYVTLTAVPASGYTFKQWNDGNTNATRTITVTGNTTYTAYFETVSGGTTNYTLTLLADPTNGGTVAGGGSYVAGEYATITATENSGYKFIGWYENGEAKNWANPVTIGVSNNRTITAKFEPVSGGELTVNEGIETSFDVAQCTEQGGSNTSLSNYTLIKFVPKQSGVYEFKATSSTAQGSSAQDTYGRLYNSYQSEVLAENDTGQGNGDHFSFNYDCQANTVYYIAVKFYYPQTGSGTVNILVTLKSASGGTSETVQVTIQPAFSAWGSVSVNGAASTSESKTYTFNIGQQVTLAAFPNTNNSFSFSYWYDSNGGVKISSANPYTFIVTSNTPKIITAM